MLHDVDTLVPAQLQADFASQQRDGLQGVDGENLLLSLHQEGKGEEEGEEEEEFWSVSPVEEAAADAPQLASSSAAAAAATQDSSITAASASKSVTRTARITHELACCLTNAVAYARTWNWPDAQRGSECKAHILAPAFKTSSAPGLRTKGFTTRVLCQTALCGLYPSCQGLA
jgi:hypothetical protein